MTKRRLGSSSIEQPEYWWYRARGDLLHAALSDYVDQPTCLLDVGSADGPSVGWLQAPLQVSVDLDPRGLGDGGLCASALSLPFVAGCFDVVSAFDVIEHCESEAAALAELSRVLRTGGRLLVSVPAYQWAWTDHDVRAGHYRRYTRRRLVNAVESAGFTVRRATYGFTGVFPFFAAERLSRRLRSPLSTDGGLPTPDPRLERTLMRLSESEAKVLRRHDLPFGSSVFLAADKSV